MITRLLKRIRRWHLEADIATMEAEIACIQKQRANDFAVEVILGATLARQRRKLQVIVQKEAEQTTADLVRRIKL